MSDLPKSHAEQVTVFFEVTDPADIQVGDVVRLTAPGWNEFSHLDEEQRITYVNDDGPVFLGQDGRNYVIYGPGSGEVESDDYRALVIERPARFDAPPVDFSDLDAAVRAVREAAEGDSNDEEIDAYRNVLDTALGLLGRPEVYDDTYAPAEDEED